MPAPAAATPEKLRESVILEPALSYPAQPKPVSKPASGTAPTAPQRMDDVRSGTTQAAFNQDASGFWIFQVLIAAIGGGIFFASWWIGLGILLGLLMVAMVPVIGPIVGLILATATGFAVYSLVQIFEPAAGVVAGIIGFLAALGANMAGAAWVKDVNKDRKH